MREKRRRRDITASCIGLVTKAEGEARLEAKKHINRKKKRKKRKKGRKKERRTNNHYSHGVVILVNYSLFCP
jgi:hypothetical protein